MDIQRIVIFIAIAIVSVLLLIEWREFKELRSVVPLAESQFETSSAEKSIDKITTDVPKEENDIPELTHEESPDQPKDSVATTMSPEKRVHITTDALDFVIDLEGGDIISLALPKHYARLDTPNVPFALLKKTPTEIYVAQSGLIGKNGTDTNAGRPTFLAEKTQYALAENENELIIDLHYQQTNEISITKRFRLKRGDYLIEMEYLIHNQSSQPWEANLFAQIKRDGHKPISEVGGMGVQPYLGAALRTTDQRYHKIPFKNLDEKPYKEVVKGGWVAMVQHYFVTAWIPAADENQTYNLRKVNNSDLYILGFTSGVKKVAPNEKQSLKFSYYAGPKDQYRLEKIAEGLELTVDYGWLWFVAQPLFALMTFYATGVLHLPFDITVKLFSGIGNWGVTIILLTLTVKASFFYLSAASYRSMANMRRVQPKMLEIKEKYGDNRQKMSEETMKLYKEEKVNPLGGCLPILVQMPVFIALYWVLLESVELRHAPFIGYIRDLSVMDPYFVMPLIMGVTMFVQQKLNPPPPDPMQAKVMQWMPVMFTFFFLWFPAGLVLYWIVNNSLSILQQWIITRQIEAKGLK